MGVVYAHVGDSRVYRLRNSKLDQLTIDHSLLADLQMVGDVSPFSLGGVLIQKYHHESDRHRAPCRSGRAKLSAILIGTTIFSYVFRRPIRSRQKGRR